MDRRDFVKTSALAGFSLFLPKFERGIWKPRPKPDWEMVLLGPEVSGAEYARISGSWADIWDPVSKTIANKSSLIFPPVTKQGVVSGARFIDHKHKLPREEYDEYVTLSTSNNLVLPGDRIEFRPGDFSIT